MYINVIFILYFSVKIILSVLWYEFNSIKCLHFVSALLAHLVIGQVVTLLLSQNMGKNCYWTSVQYRYVFSPVDWTPQQMENAAILYFSWQRPVMLIDPCFSGEMWLQEILGTSPGKPLFSINLQAR